MREWLAGHETLLWWMGVLSAVALVGSILAVPWFIARLPADYLSSTSHKSRFWPKAHPAVWWPVLILKNVLGGVLVLCGIAMLALPGQGLLTIVVGLMLMDFPGRRELVRWIMERRTILRGINWIRRKAKRPPLRALEAQ